MREVITADIPVKRIRLDEIDDRIPLATQRHRACLRAFEASVCVTRKRQAAAKPARVDVEAAFQAEDDGKTIAELLGAVHSPAAARGYPRRELKQAIALDVADDINTVFQESV